MNQIRDHLVYPNETFTKSEVERKPDLGLRFFRADKSGTSGSEATFSGRPKRRNSALTGTIRSGIQG